MLVTTLQLLPLHLFIWGLLEDSFFAAFLPKDFSFAILLLLFVEGSKIPFSGAKIPFGSGAKIPF